MANLYAGTSGFAYPTWKPGFYPAKLPANHARPAQESNVPERLPATIPQATSAQPTARSGTHKPTDDQPYATASPAIPSTPAATSNGRRPSASMMQ